jgi:hypothetical protein
LLVVVGVVHIIKLVAVVLVDISILLLLKHLVEILQQHLHQA